MDWGSFGMIFVVCWGQAFEFSTNLGGLLNWKSFGMILLSAAFSF